jgi:hypothetical protein
MMCYITTDKKALAKNGAPTARMLVGICGAGRMEQFENWKIA